MTGPIAERTTAPGCGTALVHLHFLALDHRLADRRPGAHPELWWSAEWAPVGHPSRHEDSAPRLDDLVEVIVLRARHDGGVRRFDRCLHQDIADPIIATALAASGVTLPGELER